MELIKLFLESKYISANNIIFNIYEFIIISKAKIIVKKKDNYSFLSIFARDKKKLVIKKNVFF